MNILLTGGAGFIGSHLAAALLERGDCVVVLDDFNDYYDPKLKRSNIRSLGDSDRLTVVEGDIRDAETLELTFARMPFDVVVHLAARTGVRPSLNDPILYTEVNCTGTMRILDAMSRTECRRMVFASSSSVYGNPSESPFHEELRVDQPVSPYAATKVAGELYCRTYHMLHNISVTALRFFTVYGPRQRPDMAIRKFTQLIDAGKPIPFYGDGSTERDYTYYTDIIAGLVAAVDRDLGYEIINLGESRMTSLSHLVELIETNLGKNAERNMMPMQPGDVDRTCADVNKARELLDYQPSTQIEDGIRMFVDWYRKNKE